MLKPCQSLKIQNECIVTDNSKLSVIDLLRMLLNGKMGSGGAPMIFATLKERCLSSSLSAICLSVKPKPKQAQQPIKTKENITTSQWELRVSGESWTFLRKRILPHYLPPSPLGYPYKPFTLVVYVKGKFPFSENVLGVFHLNQLLPHAFLGIQTCPVL